MMRATRDPRPRALASVAALVQSAATPALSEEGGHAHIERQTWSFGGFTRPVRPGPAAARLPDLQGRLLRLPRPEAGLLPQPGPARRARSSRRRREGARRRLAEQDHRRSRRQRQDVRAPGQALRSDPRPLSRTTRRRAPARTARCRRICRSSPRPATSSTPGRSGRIRSRCCVTSPPAIRKAAPTTSTRC